MKVSWDEDEWYPVFSITKYHPEFDDKPIEISEEEYADYIRVMKEFDDWQDKIEKFKNK